MNPDDWNGRTMIVDEEHYAIEVPVMDGGTVLCPEGNCRKQFDTDDVRWVKGLLAHSAMSHDVQHRVSLHCDICSTEFEVRRKDSDRKYCSLECSYAARRQNETIQDVTDDIRSLVGTDGDGEYPSKDELEEIRSQLQQLQSQSQTPQTTVRADD